MQWDGTVLRVVASHPCGPGSIFRNLVFDTIEMDCKLPRFFVCEHLFVLLFQKCFYVASCNKCNLQFVGRKFYFHRIQSTLSQSQLVYAHKQKNVPACSPFQLYQTRDF